MARGALALAALAIAGGSASATRSQDAGNPVMIEGDAVRLSDLAVVPASMADPVVARMAAGETRLDLAAETVAAILRRHAPGGALQPVHPGDRTFVRQAASNAGGAPRCSRLNQAVGRGDFILPEMLAPSGCDAATRAAVAFDREARALVATEDLPAGAWLGRVSLVPGPAPLRVAQPLRLQVRSGPVVIEREVRTLQAARPGEKVFVLTEEGDVLSAEIAPPDGERTTP